MVYALVSGTSVGRAPTNSSAKKIPLAASCNRVWSLGLCFFFFFSLLLLLWFLLMDLAVCNEISVNIIESWCFNEQSCLCNEW